MTLKLRSFAIALACAPFVFAADKPAPTLASIIDGSLSGIEREIVPLVEAMPEQAMNFAPTSGEFKGVRTFALQAKHVGFVIYAVSSASLGEKNPSTSDEAENGPATVKTKEDIVKYLKDAFAYAHRAAQSVTAQNATELMASPFGEGKMPKLGAINVAVWHSFDHYGQMVVYARMNGIVPPASRQ
jgi:DinB superfamily